MENLLEYSGWLLNSARQFGEEKEKSDNLVSVHRCILDKLLGFFSPMQLIKVCAFFKSVKQLNLKSGE